MADSPKSEAVRSPETAAAAREAEAQKAPDRVPAEPAEVKQPDNRVEVELNPDFELPEGADSVSVEVGSFEAIELAKGATVKVPLEHARVLVGIPAVRRVG